MVHERPLQEVDRTKTRALVDFCVLLLLFIVANPQAGGDLVVVAPVGGVIFECEPDESYLI